MGIYEAETGETICSSSYDEGGDETAKEALAEALREIWESVLESLLESLYTSMPRQVAAVIKAEGWYTRY